MLNFLNLNIPRLRSRPKLVYDQTQSSTHPCAPRQKLQGLEGSSSALQYGRWSDQRSISSEKSDHRPIRAHMGLIRGDFERNYV